jgi:hypothetical protein
MFTYIWKSRIKELERKMEKLQQEKNCASGVHNWIMIDGERQNPYIRCTECYKQPEKQS